MVDIRNELPSSLNQKTALGSLCEACWRIGRAGHGVAVLGPDVGLCLLRKSSDQPLVSDGNRSVPSRRCAAAAQSGYQIEQSSETVLVTTKQGRLHQSKKAGIAKR